MTEIAEQIRAVQQALGEKGPQEEESKGKVTEMIAMQEKLEQRIAQVESQIVNDGPREERAQAEKSNDNTEAQLSGSASDEIKASIKTLEERTKQGFLKVKTDFKELSQNMQNQQKETDQEQAKKMTQIEDQLKTVQSALT